MLISHSVFYLAFAQKPIDQNLDQADLERLQ